MGEDDLIETVKIELHCPTCGQRFKSAEMHFGHTCPANPRPVPQTQEDRHG